METNFRGGYISDYQLVSMREDVAVLFEVLSASLDARTMGLKDSRGTPIPENHIPKLKILETAKSLKMIDPNNRDLLLEKVKLLLKYGFFPKIISVGN